MEKNNHSKMEGIEGVTSGMLDNDSGTANDACYTQQ